MRREGNRELCHGLLYLLASLYAWLRGGDAYRDNPFEREAYERAASSKHSCKLEGRYVAKS
jgi:hypothetical protein